MSDTIIGVRFLFRLGDVVCGACGTAGLFLTEKEDEVTGRLVATGGVCLTGAGGGTAMAGGAVSNRF